MVEDLASFEQTQEALMLLNLRALGNRDIETGRATRARDVIGRLKAKAATD